MSAKAQEFVSRYGSVILLWAIATIAVPYELYQTITTHRAVSHSVVRLLIAFGMLLMAIMGTRRLAKSTRGSR
jgi:hypothetical protein